MDMYNTPYFLILFCLALLSSCQPGDNENDTEKKKETPREWLHFQSDNKSNLKNKIVLVSGDEEYRSEEALPQLAKILNQHHGFNCKVLFSQDPNHPGIIDPNETTHIPGLEALDEADLLILFTRFRDLPDEQMQHFLKFIQAGKPIIGIRTATHAFKIIDTTSNWQHWGNYYNGEKTEWAGGFGRKVLGVNWHSHHGHHKHQSTRGLFADEMKSHPLLNGIGHGDIWGSTDVYGVPLPLPGDAQPILLGLVVNRSGDFNQEDLFYGMKPTDSEIATSNPANKNVENPNDPMMPIVWSKSYQVENGKKGSAITSTIGASVDILNEPLRRLFVNAVYHLLELPVPDSANVKLVGDFTPTQFQFHSDEYWTQKNMRILDFHDER